ncbi:MAG: alpha-L-rhamnosidase C-terminal domain-containing protein [Actinomycetota bacterium]
MLSPDRSSPFPPGRWSARWIWAGAEPGRHVVALRRVFELDRVPAAAPLRCYTVGRHVVWVNGHEVVVGPVRANPREGHTDVVDVHEHLRRGENVLAIQAVHQGGDNAWTLQPPAASGDLALGAFVAELLLDDELVVSDDSWEGRVVAGWTGEAARGIGGRGREIVHAGSLDSGWRTDADGSWPAAELRSAASLGWSGDPRPPSHPVGPYGIRPLPVAPAIEVPVRERGGGVWNVERVEVGTLVLDVVGPAEACIDITAGEFIDDHGELEADDVHDNRLRIVTDGGRRTVETVDRYGFRALRVEADPGCTVHSVTVRDRNLRVQGDASFRCSDPLLERIWEVGRRSVTINSFDAYTDCPTREQRAWTGDSVVHQLVDLTTNADWSLARRHPFLAASPRPDGMLPMAVAGDIEGRDPTVIPDWALHWVHSVFLLHRYTGDAELVAPLLPVVEGVLRWFDRFDDGTGVPTDVTGWVIIDWAANYTAGVCAPLVGLLGRSLRELAAMSRWVDDAGTAAWADRRHEQLRVGVERLWDAGRGLYVDCTADGPRGRAVSEHAQAALLVGDLVPRERQQRLVEVMEDRDRRVWATFMLPGEEATPGVTRPFTGAHLMTGPPEPWWDVEGRVVGAQPFFRYVVHDALVAAGRSDLLPARCRDWAWALERCDTSLAETWFGGTISHAWGATPTRDAMTRILGVEPADPGFGVARIEPELGDLDWASGRVPSPFGSIAVQARAERVEVDSPVPFVHRGDRHDAGRHVLAP